jgi:hypothetical protein
MFIGYGGISSELSIVVKDIMFALFAYTTIPKIVIITIIKIHVAPLLGIRLSNNVLLLGK